MHLAARKLVAKALDGDVSALREIGDRIDGKAMQPIEHGLTSSLEELVLAAARQRLER